MPYLMGGFPDLATSLRDRRGLRRRRRRPGRARRPVLRPARRRPGDPRGRHRGAAPRGDARGDPRARRRAGAARSRSCSCATRTSSRTRASRRFATALREHGISGLIVPDLPLEEAPELRAALRRARASRSSRWSRRRRPTSGSRASARQARGFLYTVSLTGRPASAARSTTELADLLAARAARTDVPAAVGFGIGTPEQAAAAADAGADGVIIGSRLVRAAGEAEDPAAEVRALVAGFADGAARDLPRGPVRVGSGADGPRTRHHARALPLGRHSGRSASGASTAFCSTVVIVLVAATLKSLAKYLPGVPSGPSPAAAGARLSRRTSGRSPDSGGRPS